MGTKTGLAHVLAAGLEGIDGFPVEVEAEISGGAQSMRVVGLPDAALREACVRVLSALRSCGYRVGNGRIVVNLAPARRRKEEGAAFDLPAALAILAASDAPALSPADLTGIAALGELTLSGRTRPVRGALAAGETLARTCARTVLVPRRNARAVALGAGSKLTVVAVDSLLDAVVFLRQGAGEVVPPSPPADPLAEREDLDLVDVRGAEGGKQALLVAAAGGHELLFVGPPGAGKTMLARRLPGLLPPLRREEVLEVSRIHDAVLGAHPDRADSIAGLVRRRPFRAPHHTISYAALVGGGSNPRPGEISLAHKGVLFLDELPEFSSRALEALREPLELRTITVARARRTATYPAGFQLVAAMNPCPCGYLGDPTRACRCAPITAERYANRISGPLLDRIDLQARLRAVPFDLLQSPAPPRDGPQGTAALRARVAAAHATQRERSGRLNARLADPELERVFSPTNPARRALRAASRAERLSARGVKKVQRVARTLADLEGRTRIDSDDIELAIHLRVGEGRAA